MVKEILRYIRLNQSSQDADKKWLSGRRGVTRRNDSQKMLKIYFVIKIVG
jgi:hypothetical protein